MAGRLEGKIAIVAGADCVGPGWGNGRATCVRFAEDGARIFAVDLRSDTMEETLERVRAAGPGRRKMGTGSEEQSAGQGDSGGPGPFPSRALADA